MIGEWFIVTDGLNVSGVRGDLAGRLSLIVKRAFELPPPQLPVGVAGDLMLSAEAGELRLVRLSAGLVGSISNRFSLSSATVAVSSKKYVLVSFFTGIRSTGSDFLSVRAYHGTSALVIGSCEIFLSGGAALLGSVSDSWRLIEFFGAPNALNQADKLGVALCFTSVVTSAGFISDNAGSSSGLSGAGIDESSTGSFSPESARVDPMSLSSTVPRLNCSF